MKTKPKIGYLMPAGGLINKTGVTGMLPQAFQYHPADVSDSRQIGWNFEQIPGGSHPLVYWSSGGERTISFTAQFSRDINGNITPSDIATGNVPEAVFDRKRNPDLRAVAKWLDWYSYPLYVKNGRSMSPPTLLLVLPGLQLGFYGDDDILCVLTSCEKQYKDFWPDGSPRRMDASLSFVEIVQEDGKVFWHSRDSLEVKQNSSSWGALDYLMPPK